MNTHFKHSFNFATLILTLAVACLAPTAYAQHGDLWLSTDTVNNKVATGIVNEEGTEYTPGARSLEVILVPDTLPFSPFDYSAEDPGFRAALGDLPASQTVGLTLQSLSIWNGLGLEPVMGVTFNFDLSAGFATQPDGSLHEHVLYGLTANTSPVPDGVYVAAFRISTGGLADSDLFHFVMLKDELIANESDAEILEELLEDFEDGGPAPVFGGKDFAFFEEAASYVAAVPEPTGLSLVCCVALSFVSSRRRK